ncbi:glycosyl transferase [Clostridium sp. CM027]|uniref:glycosyltransferase family 32 protein n=1 Tax=Clostridium sp. CM027 TaxID=2849865 RepID=UPI001C6E2753|nr:glycosyltransferase [Clostridium sp. CM027]MBW9145258.1 glycosyl transferase [Clostridium sp. CM027]UVE40390.1 glycosyl transferase [Clostridium sp. CM027]
MKKSEIPKTIHYCWFGKGKKSELAEKCIQSWKEKLHGYEIIEWNEENFDIHANTYVEEAYISKKYAFVADYARLFVLFNYGGIYMDTDVEILKPFNNLLELEGFVGFEDKELVSTAVIGSQKGNLLINEWLLTYNNRHFTVNGKINSVTNVRVLTDILLKYGMKQNNQMQKLYDNKLAIYPIEYFSPFKIGGKKPNITKDTISIHWFEGTWITLSHRIKIRIITMIKSVVGFQNYNRIKKYIKGKVNFFC